MTLLKNLTAEANGDAAAPRQIMHGVHEEVTPGQFRCFRLTRESLICSVSSDAKHGVVIPLSEIATLVGKFAPKFVNPPKK